MSFRDQYKPTEGKLLKKYGAKTNEIDGAMRKLASGGCVIKKAGGGGVMGDDSDEPFSGDLEGDAPSHRADRKSKGNTTVNIIVGKGGPEAQPPMPPPMPAGPPPPMAGPPGPPHGMPPMPMRAAGGRIKKADGGWIGEGDTGKKMRAEAEASKNDKVLAPVLGGIGVALSATRLGKMGKAIAPAFAGAGAYQGLRSAAKEAEASKLAKEAEGRATGGRMTAGADSGIGRLQKAKMQKAKD